MNKFEGGHPVLWKLLSTQIRFMHCGILFILLFRTIPPEQQAEADELEAAFSKLQATTMHECQEVVSDCETQSANLSFYEP